MRELFGTDGIRGVANRHPMTAEVAMQLGRAITHRLRKKHSKPRIVIGKDTRRSGYMLETALTAGITSMGGKAFLLGPIPTPAVAYHIRGLRAHGGVMISASHNPYQDNGLKVFGENGFKLDDVTEKAIEESILNPETLEKGLPGSEKMGRALRIDDASGRYLSSLKTKFPRDFDLEGMRIVFDAANGAAYDCGVRLFKELGAEVVARANQPNGFNINKECAQEDPQLLSRAVLEQQADVGIGVDGDADRLMIVDERGAQLSGEHFMYEMACYLRDQGRLESNVVVTTSMANQALEVALQDQGIELLRAQVGDRYVTEMLKDNGAIFGGETSGHYIFLDQNTTADGLFSSLEILNLMKHQGVKASSLVRAFKLYPQRLMNVEVREKPEIGSINSLVKAVQEIEKKYADKGRINIRYSGTQMIMRVMVEGPQEKEVESDCIHLSEIVKKEIGVVS